VKNSLKSGEISSPGVLNAARKIHSTGAKKTSATIQRRA